MRINLNLTEQAKERLGDAAVVALLIVAFLATGCGIPDEQKGADSGLPSESVGELTPVVHIPTPAVEPAPEPAVTERRPATFEEGESAYREGRYGEAVELFTSYNETKPSNPWGLYMLGLSARKAGNDRLAEVAFAEALSKDPRHVKSLLNLSRVLLETDRPEEALGEIEFAIEIDSTSGEALRLKGVALHDVGRVEEAIETYRRALTLNDRDVWTMNNLGFVYLGEHRFVDALPPLARAVELEPEVALFQNNLGMALERSGYVGSAVEAYRAAVAADSSFAKARANLGRVEQWGVDLDIKADLRSFAELFVQEIERWKSLEAAAVEIPTDTAVTDTIP
jgi:tetratricopeptide (TPR) repeat protein